jgi:hypothetical protein
LFFRTGAMAGARPATWHRYAHSLVVWLEFLAVFGRSWDEATARDVEAFKDWRLTDLRNDEVEANAADPLAPPPLRDRAAAQASRAQDIIARHQATRPPAGGGEIEDSGGR